MRRILCVGWGLAALMLPALLPVQADAISLTDYKFPTSTSQEAYVNGVFNGLGNSIDSTEVGIGLAGSGSYRLNYRSLPLSYDLSVQTGFSVSKGTEKDAETEDSWNIIASTTADKYFRDTSKVFGFGSIAAEYRKLAAADDPDDPRVDIEVGAGYGRTINATVLKQAIRMNEDFRKYNIISGDLPDAALLELASIIDREGEFRSEHGNIEYRKFWYEAMEEVLAKSGMLTGSGLGALGVLRIQEVLDEPTSQRWHGWSARAGIGMRVSDFDGESGDPRASVRFDYARPISLDLQFTNNALFATVFEDDPVYSFQNTARVDYEISNRIDWYNSLGLMYDMPTATGLENIFRLALTSTYIFYIENSLSVNPEFQYRYLDDGIGDAEWDWAVLGSISYRLR